MQIEVLASCSKVGDAVPRSPMRSRVQTPDEARTDLGAHRSRPGWIERDHGLPFESLSDDEFEILIYLLLTHEHPGDSLWYYGKTGDSGRDVIRRDSSGKMYLIQCKRYSSNLGVGEVRRELAKLCTNVYQGAIDPPDVVAFYVARDLTAPAQDLLNSQRTWVDGAREALREHLKTEPPAALVNFAATWWPQWERVTGVLITERLQKHPQLVEEFFAIRKVVDAQLADSLVKAVERIDHHFGTRPPEVSYAAKAQALPTVELFVGREATLDELRNALCTGNTAIIGGIPGIGKSTVAARLAMERSLFPDVVWIDCDPYGRLDSVLSRLSEHLSQKHSDTVLRQSLAGGSSSPMENIDIAVASLEQHQVAAVFDNFDANTNKTLVLLLTECNRSFKRARLVITTRAWQDDVPFVNMPYHCTLAGLDSDASLDLWRYCLQRSGVIIAEQNLQAEALSRVGGHPYFVRLLAELSRKYSLADLLTGIPRFTNQAQAYVRKHVIETLPDGARTLLARLSLLRIPFEVDTITDHVESDPWTQFEFLVDRFLVTRHAAGTARYDVHAIIREFTSAALTNAERTAGHEWAHQYYAKHATKGMTESFECVYHALRASRLSDAASVANKTLGALMIAGLPDVLLEWTDTLLRDEVASSWPIVHFQRGRVFRLKKQWDDAVLAYKSTLHIATDQHTIETTKAEIASLLVGRSDDPESPEWKQAIEIYQELAKSPNDTVRVSVHLSLGWLRTRAGDGDGMLQMHEALRLAEDAGLERQIAQCCYFLGRLYASDDCTRAIEYLTRGIEVWDSMQRTHGAMNWDGLYHSADLLSDLLLDADQYAGAIVPAKMCVELDGRLGRRRSLVRSLLRLGQAHCMIGNFGEALAALEEGLGLVRSYREASDMESAILEFLVIAYWNSHMHIKALETMAEYRRACATAGTEESSFAFVPESAVDAILNDADVAPIRHRFLALSGDVDFARLRGWIESVVDKYPDFGGGWTTNIDDPHWGDSNDDDL